MPLPAPQFNIRLAAKRWLSNFLTVLLLFGAIPAFGDPLACGEIFSDPVVATSSEADSFFKQAKQLLFSGLQAIRRRPYLKLFDDKGQFLNDAVDENEISSETGSQPLKLIRLNVNNNKMSESVLLDYANVLRQMPDLKLVLVVHKLQAPAVRRLVNSIFSREDLPRIQIVYTKSLVWIWAQDGSKPLRDGSGTLMQNRGTAVNREGYRKATKQLEDAGLAVRTSTLPFEGGNVIVGDRHIFMGTEIVKYTQKRLGITKGALLRAYERQFGKPVIEIGATDEQGDFVQPFFHVDLFMSVVQDLRSPDKKDVVLLHSSAFLDTIQFHSPGEKIFFSPKLIAAKEKQMEQIKTQLEQAGYEVIRIPGYYDKYNFGNRFVYTNAIFSDGVALVPSYGVPEINQLAFDVYRKLGYEVIPMPSSATTIRRQGAIRCVSETYRTVCQ